MGAAPDHFSAGLRVIDGDRAADATSPQSRLAAILCEKGVISARRLAAAEQRADKRDGRLADVLRLDLLLPAMALAQAEADIASAGMIDPVTRPVDPRLLRQLGPALCLKYGILPWRQIGGQTIVLTARPDEFMRHRDGLRAVFGPVRMAVSTEEQLTRALCMSAGRDLITKAETRVAEPDSCRMWNTRRAQRFGLAGIATLGACLILWPYGTLGALTLWAAFTLLCHALLKAAIGHQLWHDPPARPQAARPVPARLPVVTVFVPLFREREIAGQLVTRLSQIDYPRELLDVCLLLEEDDLVTRQAVAETNLPRWMRAIPVPRGAFKTKPRALNYGLSFARGTIIGVYDAEDCPAPDQLLRVVARFAERGQDVACLQGVLDFYNSGSNWLARCFTLEYSTWFRMVLPGLERLGLVIPLGGTTLFFRRDALENLGGWDAHNVTEDADLGVRLARRGFRTELINTVTEEEANCRPWPWVKQRSRWLKGYAITYAVHMRDPVQLWRDLGTWRFFGVQLLFLGTLSQFVLAPLLWSFWMLPLGLGHPLQAIWPPAVFWALGGLFLSSELLNIAVTARASVKAGRPGLALWAPTMHLYFPLAALAVYKGLAELFWKPFYWDKTTHGIYHNAPGVRPSPQPPSHPDATG